MPFVEVTLALLGVADAGVDADVSSGVSGLMVEVEVERPKELVRGAR